MAKKCPSRMACLSASLPNLATWRLNSNWGRADRLTFVSDGVVEARNAKGELLGFDRMAELTTKRAAEIAEAALHWGQEDDITVLSLTFAPVGVAHV